MRVTEKSFDSWRPGLAIVLLAAGATLRLTTAPDGGNAESEGVILPARKKQNSSEIRVTRSEFDSRTTTCLC